MYVGASKHINNRVKEHFRCLVKGDHPNKKLQNSFNKYGNSYFIWGIYKLCEDLGTEECKAIESLNPYYNLKKGGSGITDTLYTRSYVTPRENGLRLVEFVRNNKAFHAQRTSEGLLGLSHTRNHRVSLARARGLPPLQVYDTVLQQWFTFDFVKEVATFVSGHPDSVDKAILKKWLLFGRYYIIRSSTPPEEFELPVSCKSPMEPVFLCKDGIFIGIYKGVKAAGKVVGLNQHRAFQVVRGEKIIDNITLKYIRDVK